MRCASGHTSRRDRAEGLPKRNDWELDGNTYGVRHCERHKKTELLVGFYCRWMSAMDFDQPSARQKLELLALSDENSGRFLCGENSVDCYEKDLWEHIWAVAAEGTNENGTKSFKIRWRPQWIVEGELSDPEGTRRASGSYPGDLSAPLRRCH